MRLLIFGSGLVGLVASACSGSTTAYTADADRGSTHAIVSVERKDSLAPSSAPEAKAFASFVHTPPEVDAAAVARITGLELNLPEPGECTLGPLSRDGGLALSPLRRVELLAAGDVALETPEGRVELAPRAFPAVTDLVAGVVYTTRDRAATLPAGEVYALNAAGSAWLAPFGVSAEAPPALTGVTLAGVPISATNTLVRAGTELGWRAGSGRDLVYVTLAPANASPFAVCAFRDDAGHGALPARVIPSSDLVNLSLHRLRSVALSTTPNAGIDTGELRFDFELDVSLIVDEN